MTRKDYELIANAIAQVSHETGSVAEVAYSIANALQTENSRFDYNRFIKATKVHETV